MTFLAREYKFDTTSNMLHQQKDQHTMAICNLKKLVKPLLRLIKKRQFMRKTLADIQQQNSYNSSLDDMRNDDAALTAQNDNSANEALEQRLFAEIRDCTSNAAVIVQQGEQQHIVPVQPQHKYIPVHFARTANGTFFWTSIDVLSREQELELRMQFDRWGQA